ncbi:MAG: hypothetical protein HYS62_01075 [Candidatus Aenigmarchaeota archaeon]|nr:hypothetical protein [Candidatus Aenigmarchaeota archaeon]
MAVKLKGKQWFKIISPKFFGEKEIGQTVAGVPDALIGKTINMSAIELTDDINKYYMTLKLKINSVNGDKASTEFVGSECMQDYISRMVLHRVRRIDTVQDLTTNDDVKIRIKGLTIIPKRAKSSIEVKVREFVAASIKKVVEDSTLEELLMKILANEIKNKILKEGRTIYPIRNFEVRKTEIIQ